MNWFLAIIAGGIAGWIAEKLMGSSMGLIRNILLGIFGAIVGSALLSFLFDGFSRHSGFIAYIIAGVVGGCIIIALYRAIMGGRARA